MSVTRLPLQAEVQLSLRDLAVACGISATRAARLVRLGLVEPQPDAPDRFSSATAALSWPSASFARFTAWYSALCPISRPRSLALSSIIPASPVVWRPRIVRGQ